MKLSRLTLFCALAVPILWMLTALTRFETHVTLTSDGAHVTGSIHGQTLQAPIPVRQVSALTLTAPNSIYPLGCERLVLEQAGQRLIDTSIPRFESKAWIGAATADWWIAQKPAPDAVVFHQPLDVTGPFSLDATFTGRTFMPIRIELEGSPGLSLLIRRGLLMNDAKLVSAGGQLLAQVQLESAPATVLANLVDPWLRGLLMACALIAGLGSIAVALTALRGKPGKTLGGKRDGPVGGGPSGGARTGRGRLIPWTPLILLLVFVHLGQSIWMAVDVLDAIPHFMDDLCYLIRAKWLLAGHLSQPMPPYWPHLDTPGVYFNHDLMRWIVIYPIGWPLLLAMGEAFHVPWLVAPACAAVGIGLIYRLGKELYGPTTALAAALLAVLSPMSVLMSASMLSHAATFTGLLLSTWLLISGTARLRIRRLAGAGLVLGFVFGIRPLTAVAVAAPMGLFLLYELAVSRDRHRTLRGCLALVAGGLLGVLPVFVDNALTTGHPLVFAYQQGASVRYGLSATSLMVSDSTLALLSPMAFGWGWGWIQGGDFVHALGYAFLLIPFLTARATRHDVLLLGIFMSVQLAYLGHGRTGMHGFGPRFYYDVFFCLFLLTARGFACLSAPGASSASIPTLDDGSEAAVPPWPSMPPGKRRNQSPAFILTLVLFLSLTLSAASSLPFRLRDYTGYHWIFPILPDAVAAQNITRGVILLEPSSFQAWILAAPLMPGRLDADLVVLARGTETETLKAAFGDRPWYVWSHRELTPYPEVTGVMLPSTTTNTTPPGP